MKVRERVHSICEKMVEMIASLQVRNGEVTDRIECVRFRFANVKGLCAAALPGHGAEA